MARRRFRRVKRSETVRATFDPREVELLRSLPDAMRAALSGAPDDPVVQRLFPHAYLDPTEETAEQQWQALTFPDLLASRLAALDVLMATLDRGVERGDAFEVDLEPEEVQAWIGVLNDTRLALGTALEITEDERTVEADDPRADQYLIYDWLTWVQGELIELLLD